ncbi:replicative DNA helicase [Candidatus Marinimicrobia bacterium]|jgi:replicative DNA helicase|nr:replicative DNA helicase [Candidatus Neomarinimicrobiota bacterium]MDC0911418.1 replicative DNA helicase [Candidatus Neomarinimicrobiota bacterium]|tara:strand:+ start:477 stop:1835 length:1359 start_codon:yes stop_codon:yes gene_type:complete
MANKKNDILNVQPHSDEAEQAVLGSMLSDKEAVNKAFEKKLDAVHFYKKNHSLIFAAMSILDKKNEPIDTVSVVDVLTKNNDLETVGGAFYISGLVDLVPTTAHVARYIKIVMEKAILRNLIYLSNDISKEAFDDSKDVDDILESVQKSIFNITQDRLQKGFEKIDPVLHKTFEDIDRIASHKGSVIGVPTGFSDLDAKTTGFQAGDLVIIAGRPGMGKTSFALNMMRNAAIDANKKIGFFSLEMANNQLAMRLLCAEARVDSNLVRSGTLPKSQYRNLSLAVGPLSKAEIHLDDTPALSILELRAKARRIKNDIDIDMIIVDYLQLMQGPKGVESRQQEIATISRSMKALAKELDIPIVALSQLSRAVEQRTGSKRPQLSDLRESGAIEQDADVVLFLFRPWVYSRDDEDEGKAEIIIAKQRNGPTGIIEATYINRYTRFENLAHNPDAPF